MCTRVIQRIRTNNGDRKPAVILTVARILKHYVIDTPEINWYALLYNRLLRIDLLYSMLLEENDKKMYNNRRLLAYLLYDLLRILKLLEYHKLLHIFRLK